MKVILSRDVNLKQVEIIAEVDFTDSENPYNELFKDINSIDDLKISMRNIGMEEAEINMIISKLRKIKIINNGKIDKSIISTREYGKYEIIYLENDRLVYNLPIEIKRVKPGKNQNISNLSNSSIIKELKESKFYNSYNKENERFRIVKLEKNKEGKYLGGNSKNAGRIKLKWILDLNNKKNTWFLEGDEINRIEKSKNIDFTDERINTLLDGSWDYKNKAMNITFNEIKNNNKAINNFYLDFDKEITFDEFGKFKGEFKNIPIIPIDRNNAQTWFIYILKNHISDLNRYVSSDELEQIWNNIFENTLISKKFDLEFNFKDIVSQFEKGSNIYWQLMAGKDLNPFELTEQSKEKILNNIVIKRKNNINIYDDIISYITDKQFLGLTIIDPYIINNRHYKILEEIIKSLRDINSDILINIYTKADENEIIERVDNNLDINYNTLNTRLPHDRFWIFNDGKKRYFNVSKSIDFISYNRSRDNLNIKENTIFTELDKNDVDKKVFEIIGDDNE